MAEDEEEDEDYDLTKFHERESALMEKLAKKFIAHGFARPTEFHLRVIASLNHHILENVLIQDTGRRVDGRPNTREPVEKLHAALESVWECYNECEATSEIEPPPGRLNVARIFIELADSCDLDPRHVGSNLFFLTEAAKLALQTGIKPSKREPLLAYDDYILSVRLACNIIPPSRSALVSLLLDCEFVLPANLRARSKAAVGDRLDACRKRQRKPGDMTDPSDSPID